MDAATFNRPGLVSSAVSAGRTRPLAKADVMRAAAGDEVIAYDDVSENVPDRASVTAGGQRQCPR